MEQHPIPQDITGFKFKLVGDMTLTQFGYIAGGAIMAYVSFASKFPDLIKFPLAAFFAFGGFALAFLPVEERPLDRWIVSFIKAIYSPTQYLWKKRGTLPDYFETSYISKHRDNAVDISNFNGDRRKLEDYLKTLPQAASSTIDLAEMDFLKRISQLGPTKAVVQPSSAPPPVIDKPPTEDQKKKEFTKLSEENKNIPVHAGFSFVNGRFVKDQLVTPPPIPPKPPVTPAPVNRLETQNSELEKQALNLKDELEKIKKAQVFTVEDLNKLKDLAQRLTDVENQKNKAQEELAKLKKQYEEGKITGVKPLMGDIDMPKTPRVKFVPSAQAFKAGLPNPPEIPNIISGLVDNSKGEILPGVIVVIKDKDDIPVRAIKTNKLGHFTISTPLPNGIYNLELEKEGFSFDIIEIEIKGEIIPPMEIKAK